MGSGRDARWGGRETAGAFGPFVFPEDTERVIAEREQITSFPLTHRAPHRLGRAACGS